MKKRALIFCMTVMLAANCLAEGIKTEAEHDFAHFGGGTLAAEGMHLLDHNLPNWQKCLLETGAALGANVVYKLASDEWSDPALNERLAVGTLGGWAFYKFSF